MLDDSSPRQIPVCTWPRFHAHSDDPELWCPAGCCKELRARRQGCLEWRVESRHVACGEDRRAAQMRAIRVSLFHYEREECRWGLHTGNFERGARTGLERRAGPVRCCARWREDPNGGVVVERKRGRLRRAWEGKRRARSSRWTETCVPSCRAEYVKEQGLGERAAWSQD